MVGRIITFGCSYSYGKGLEDCYDSSSGNAGVSPSKFCYSALLEKDLNIRVENLSLPGASNILILDKILNYKFDPTVDFVLVQWSSPFRFTRFKIVDDKFDDDQIGIWVDAEYSKSYFRVFEKYHMLLDSYRCIQHAELYLKSNNIPYFFFTFFSTSYEDILPNKLNIQWFKTPVKSLDHLIVDKALNKKHPGKGSHKLVSHFLQTIIQKEIANEPN